MRKPPTRHHRTHRQAVLTQTPGRCCPFLIITDILFSAYIIPRYPFVQPEPVHPRKQTFEQPSGSSLVLNSPVHLANLPPSLCRFNFLAPSLCGGCRLKCTGNSGAAVPALRPLSPGHEAPTPCSSCRLLSGPALGRWPGAHSARAPSPYKGLREPERRRRIETKCSSYYFELWLP